MVLFFLLVSWFPFLAMKAIHHFTFVHFYEWSFLIEESSSVIDAMRLVEWEAMWHHTSRKNHDVTMSWWWWWEWCPHHHSWMKSLAHDSFDQFDSSSSGVNQASISTNRASLAREALPYVPLVTWNKSIPRYDALPEVVWGNYHPLGTTRSGKLTLFSEDWLLDLPENDWRHGGYLT